MSSQPRSVRSVPGVFIPEAGNSALPPPTNILLALRQALDEYKKEGGLTARRERYIKNHTVLTEGLAKLGVRSIVAPGASILHHYDPLTWGAIDFTHSFMKR